MKMFAIFDEGVKRFLEPFFLPTEDIAIRTFTDCVNKDGHNFNLHPDQYTLFVCGEYDGDRGMVNPIAPESMCNGVSVLKPKVKPLVVASDIVEAVEARVAQIIEAEASKNREQYLELLRKLEAYDDVFQDRVDEIDALLKAKSNGVDVDELGLSSQE